MTLETTETVTSLADVRSEIDTLLLAKSWVKTGSNLYTSPSLFAGKMTLRMDAIRTTSQVNWSSHEMLLFRFGDGHDSVDSVTGMPSFTQGQGGDSNMYGCGMTSHFMGQEFFPATLKLYYYPAEFMVYGVIVNGQKTMHFMFGETDLQIDQQSRGIFYSMPFGSIAASSYNGFPAISALTLARYRAGNFYAILEYDVDCGLGHFNCGATNGSTNGSYYRPVGLKVSPAYTGLVGNGADNEDSSGWFHGGYTLQGGTLNGSEYTNQYQRVQKLGQRFGTAVLLPMVALNRSTINTNAWTPLAYIPNIRLMYLDNYELSESLTFGGDSWHAYPMLRKGSSSGASGEYGYAIKD